MSDGQPVIVVGVDGSAASRAAITWAVKQAQLIGGTVKAVTAWHIPAMAYGSGMVFADEEGIRQATVQTQKEAIDTVIGTEPPVAIESYVAEGPAALVLVEAAEDAELLVMGSRGHGAFTGMLLGSVSDYCVSHAPCPVVVIKDPDD